MSYKKKIVDFGLGIGKIEVNYESIPRGSSDFPMHFYCEKCANQSIGDNSGTIYDCNLCKIQGDDEKGKLKYEHIYCANYVREEQK